MKRFACGRVVADPSTLFAAHHLDGILAGATKCAPGEYGPTATSLTAPSVKG
ncbi:hypothetical protein [Terriglobus albidus]|uniref:hypothetical protein n=1 Tax=Terriglobus albidus TaxID=1592106 RepID=UPI00164EABE5|nr:hypothetical protein [Terriglobus albidus]